MDLIEIVADSPSKWHHQLNRLLLETFGFSFERWHASGGWTSDFTCYVMAERGAIISSAGVYEMQLLVNGRPKQLLQIAGVATRPARRGQGLSKRLMNHILTRYPGADFFLCANETVLDFYPRFGFRQVSEHQPWLPGPATWDCLSRPGMRKLAASEPIVRDYLFRRVPLSNVLDCANAGPIQWFHLLLDHPEHIYTIPELDLMLVAEQEGSVLRLVDVIAQQPVTFNEIAPYLKAVFREAGRVEFGFNPDWLGVDYEQEKIDLNLFVRGEFGLPGLFKLPELVIT